MAITTPTICGDGEMPIAKTAPWAVNNDEDDANAAAVELKATPGAEYSLYVTHVTISSRLADIEITLRDSDDTVLFGPIQMQADGNGIFSKDWQYPLKLTNNKALEVYASAASAFTIYVEGFTGKEDV